MIEQPDETKPRKAWSDPRTASPGLLARVKAEKTAAPLDRLLAAVKALYAAACWGADRPVPDEGILWKELCDAADLTPGDSPEPIPTPTEFDPKFVKLMRAAMAMSYYKYGPLADAYPHRVKALESLKLRIDKYRETGNTEYLVDVANFAMIEFMRPSLEGAFYRGTGEGGSPGRVTFLDEKPTEKKNAHIVTKDEAVAAGFKV